MTTLSFDPGIRLTGWSALDDDLQILGQGTLRPTPGETAARIEELCTDLLTLCDEYEPTLILVEMNSGHVNRKRHHGGGAGLATNGAASAALWREALHWGRRRQGVSVCWVPENEWTRSVPKEDRAVAIAQCFPQYDPSRDRGFNIADSLGLAYYKLQELRVRRHCVSR